MNARRFLRILCGLLCLGAAASTWPAAAAMKPVVVPLNNPPAPDGERFLFVLDVSSGMEGLQGASETTLYEMIATGVGGYMRAGDTYGIWSFNKETYTGKLGMQVWDPKRNRQLATIAAAAVNGQNYEKSCNIKQLMQNLTSVIHAVSNVTIFVLSDGDTAMTGTPFDKAINAEYKKQSRLRKQAKRPFITTLLVRDGWFVNGLVHVGGQAIQLPDRPESPSLLAQTNSTLSATSSVASAKSATPSTSSGQAPSTGQGNSATLAQSTSTAAGQTQASVVTSPPPRKVMQIITQPKPPPTEPEPGKIEVAGGATPAATTTPGPNSLPTSAATVATTATSIATSTAPATNALVPNVIATASSTAAPTAPPPTVATSGSEAVHTPPALRPSPGAPATFANAPPVPVPTQSAAPVSIAPALSTPTAAPNQPVAHPPTPPVASSATTPTAASLAQQPAPATPPGLLQRLAPNSAPLVVAARERSDASAPANPHAGSTESAPAPTPSASPGQVPSAISAPTANSPTVLGVQAMAPAPLVSFASAGWMLAFGASMLAFASMLLVLVSRRTRPHGSGSLITQSMDRR